MDESVNLFRQAKPGSMVPFVKEFEGAADILAVFAKASDFGRKKGHILFESGDRLENGRGVVGENSFAVIDPCLQIRFVEPGFGVKALNGRGEKFLGHLREEDFGFAQEVEFKEKEVTGIICPPKKKLLTFEEKLLAPSPLDVLRAVNNAFRPTVRAGQVYGGLFGVFSYDFVDLFEALPAVEKSEPGYEFYFADSLIHVNHFAGKTRLVALGLKVAEDDDAGECLERLEKLEACLDVDRLAFLRFPPKKGRTVDREPKEKFLADVEKIREEIFAGNVFQAVVSREKVLDYNSVPLEAYEKLRKVNPSPYQVFLALEEGALLGASPEPCIKVSRENGSFTIELKPIAGTRPRGGNAEEDTRLEVELLSDAKERAEHYMLVDLARNDVAKVCVPGTRRVVKPFSVEKFSHVQHLVSTVRGRLREGLDCLHAYPAAMNMGTLTGAPKPEAMKLIRLLEGRERGFYGGMICYLSPEGEMDSTIAIRGIRLRGGKAFVRAGAGIVKDSVPEREFEETEEKMAACIEALKKCGGIEYG